MTSPRRDAPSLTLVRHGESEWNASRIVQGQNDTPHLTALGRRQAGDVARALRELAFDRLVASDLHRARDTADVIGSALSLTPTHDALLRERSYGVFEGGAGVALTSAVTGHAHGVVLDADARPDGGESLREVVARAEQFIERASSEWPGERVLVVTHGGMINALHLATQGEPLEGRAWYRVSNCEVWTLEGPVDTVLDDGW